MRARLGAAGFWLVAGTMHFVVPRQYEAIVPPSLARWRREIVIASGAAEIAGGIAILPDRTRRGARWWLLATLVAVYPANVHMALHPERFPKIPAAPLGARGAVEGVLGLGAMGGTREPQRPTKPSMPAELTPVWQSVGVASNASRPCDASPL